MIFFSTLLNKTGLKKHDGRPLWRYFLTNEDFHNLRKTLSYATAQNIDPRDVTLFYAEWWKRNYNGGMPSKYNVFESVGGNCKYNFTEKDFFVLAKKGAQILGVKWIKKQNTLFFKTLLLQGGLPLKQISENHGKYKSFLEAVLDEQPETIEDFMFNKNIVDILPKSSQNEMVYQNCLEIVRSIINNDDEYKDLLESDAGLKVISTSLNNRKSFLKSKKKKRIEAHVRYKNHWMLSFKGENAIIHLRLNLSNIYTKEQLTNILGFEVDEQNYQLFIDNSLVCVFRKTINNSYKTDWYNKENKKWDLSGGQPYVYVLSNGEKKDLPSFIQSIPRLDKPTLWIKLNDKEWKLINGNSTSNNKGAVLFSSTWKSKLSSKEICISNELMNWLEFEGETTVNEGYKERTFLSNVESFDWMIKSEKPNWMLKSNMTVVRGKPKVSVFDENGYDVKKERFKIYLKEHNTSEPWLEINRLVFINTGCYELKIVKGDLIAYDTFFNIGRLDVVFKNKSIYSSKIEFKNYDYLECELKESELLSVEKSNNTFSANVNFQYSKIPTSIKAKVGKLGKKRLLFELKSPFQGIAIIDENGEIIDESTNLSITKLYGLRILKSSNYETLIKIQNSLKSNVKIIKELKETSQPLISFKDDIIRLFYLGDSMYYKNSVELEIAEGKEKRKYNISGFSHTLDIGSQYNSKIKLFDSSDDLELYAIPVNCFSDEIDVFPLFNNEGYYTIPDTIGLKQFIIISPEVEGKQLMPRFVDKGNLKITIDKDERIEYFHKELIKTDFNSDLWRQVKYYFHICLQFDLPFSTFDQLRAISLSGEIASRAFFFLTPNLYDTSLYLQKTLPTLEKDLGFCFHWSSKKEWISSLNEIIHKEGRDMKYIELLSLYMQENNFSQILKFINGGKILEKRVLQSDLYNLRAELGERVLRELPQKFPKIKNDYGIRIQEHKQVKLLLKSAIAVAESISDVKNEYNIWSVKDEGEDIRRNIQYSMYLKPNFYNKTILHVISKI